MEPLSGDALIWLQVFAKGVINSNQWVRAYSALTFCSVGLRHFFVSLEESQSLVFPSLSHPPPPYPLLCFHPDRKDFPSPDVHVCTLTPRPAPYAANCTCAAGRRRPQFVPAGPHTDGPRGLAPFPLSFPLFHTSARYSVPQENNTPLNPFHPENKQRSASKYQ